MAEDNVDGDAVTNDDHKRTVKYTEKSVEARLSHYINQRRGKLRQLTAKSNEIEQLMGNNEELEGIKTKMKIFRTQLEDFKESNDNVLLYLNEDEKRDDQEYWFVPKMDKYQYFMQKVDEWIEHVELKGEKVNACDDGVTPMDSVSAVTRSSSRSSSKRSSASSASSARLLAEAKRAELEAKAAALAQKTALAVKEAQLQAEKEELEIKTALAVTNAMIKVYEDYSTHDKDAMNAHSMPADVKNSCEREEPVEEKTEHKPLLKPTTELEKPHIAASVRPKVERSLDSSVADGGCLQLQSNTTNDIYRVMKQQTDITEMLVRQQQVAQLPQRDVPVFCGDPLDFRSFLKAFDHTVASRTNSSVDKLYFLEQYTRGEPQDLVKGCQHMPADRGYQAAMRLLEDRYGNALKIATALMEKLLKWPQIKPDDAAALNSFSLFLLSCRNALEDVDYMEELDNPTNMRAIILKLPYKIREKWRAVAFETQERNHMRVRFVDLVTFVDRQAKIVTDPFFGDLQGPAIDRKERRMHIGDKAAKRVKGSSFATNVAPKEEEDKKLKERADRMPSNVARVQPCLFCKGNHALVECHHIAESSHKDKLDFIRKAGLCFGCLRKGHMSKDCKRKATCQICSEKHPSMLHIPRKEGVSEQTGVKSLDEVNSEQSVVSSALVSLDKEETPGNGAGGKCVLAVLPVYVKARSGTKIVETYAFVDPGSSATFCTDALASQLNLQGKGTKVILTTMCSTKQVGSSLIRDLQVCGLKEDGFIDLPKVFTQRSIPVTKENIPLQRDIKKWQYLQEVKIPEIDAEIGLLIGSDVYEAFEPWKVIHSQSNGPYAVKTKLGWTINGPLRECSEQQHEVSVNRISVEMVEKLLMQQYKADFPEHHCNDKLEMSQEDKHFISLVSSSVRHDNGHYYINLPTRRALINMPNNKDVAKQRALTLKKRLSKDLSFRQEYKDCIDELLSQGYAVKVPQEQLDLQDGRVWYIPHHGVYHPQKKNLRVVFDCAARYQGASLNQELIQGPDLTNTLIGVLTRFRQGYVAMMADVKAMYHQVRVPEEDTNLLRFLWWPEGDVTQEMVEYKMVVHLFGATSSASCANFALRKTAEDNRAGVSPEAVNTVLKSFYVDDCLKSVDDDSDAIMLRKELTSLCASGGFHLTKWASNSRALLQSIPEQERAKEVKDLDLTKDALPVERALGVLWCIETDCFKFRVNICKGADTRRGVLSVVSSVYDPLGFMAPVILPAKILLQQLCKQRLTWDESIPAQFMQFWTSWVNQLPLLSNFKIRRCIKPEGFGHIATAQLHHFADASEVGYGTVSFLKLTNRSEEAHCVFMMGKARVAPLKQTTIPRMELTAAVMAVNMDKMLQKELQLTLQDSVFWTDSTAVLKYIANEALRLKTFVANRVSIIKEATKVAQWRYIKSKDNPADYASRGLTAEQFMNNQSWIRGPTFLKESEYQWPGQRESTRLSEEDDEVRAAVSVHSVAVIDTTGVIDKLMNHYGSWHRLKRAVAWMLKLRKNLLRLSKRHQALENATHQHDSCAGGQVTSVQEEMQQHKVTLDKEPLTLENLNDAEMEIIRYCQRHSFIEEISALENGQVPSRRNSPIHKLDPVLQDGILRVGGRLSKSAMPEDSKHPIIMPNGLHPTTLLLRDIHEKVGHSGRNHMLSRLRQRFWIPAANSAVRRLLSRCVVCKKIQAKVQSQKMADLPADRLLPDEPPFTNVGVDYFGPIETKRGRGTVKRYGVLFTCLTTRAVHLEIAHTLDTDSCINAVRRFMCRRGQVAIMRSDNGTNLVSTEKELRLSMQQWNQAKIQDALAQKGVQWIFNPPAGPHFGGVWERQVKSVKKVLKSVLHEQTIDDEGLQTFMCEVECTLNDRPLTVSSDDVNDLEALTPNHLLLLKKQPLLPPGLFDKEDCYSRRRWRQVQYLADLFWKRWVREYLPTLQERQKWHTIKQNLTPGDIVMILDNNAPRGSWLKGKVVQTMPDREGLVRRVLVKTKSGTLERPVDKLCLICEKNA